MRSGACLGLIFAAVLVCQAASGQVDSVQRKDLEGTVWDSVRTVSLASATLAVYQARDTVLCAYTLSDKNGLFSFSHLPVNTPLKLVVSFVGFQTAVRNFQLFTARQGLQMGRIDMKAAADTLDAAVVMGVLPPVTMKGDTLEFHADAFKLDPNAQAEDLLRILPGVTIWNDGVITVNGREVSSVLVNGKPFFGSDARVATQNIPKSIIDKIQVYKKGSVGAQKDSATEINIQLKKGKEAGYFGKISGGLGTGKYYETDGSLNFFNRRTQLSVGGAANNVNKLADGMSTLLTNQTFKGQGANGTYQSDFTMPGRTTFKAAGLLLQHDFIENPTYLDNSRITGEYFLNSNRQDLLSATHTVTTANDSSWFVQNNKSVSHSDLVDQHARILYDWKKGGNVFSFSSLFNGQSLKQDELDSSLTSNRDQEPLSSNITATRGQNSTRTADVIARFTHSPGGKKAGGPLAGYSLDYSLLLLDNHWNKNLSSVYMAESNPFLNRDLERWYDNRETKAVHKLNGDAPGFVSGVLPGARLAGVHLGLKNELEVAVTRENSLVQDKNILGTGYTIDPYLTNRRHDLAYDERPLLSLSKNHAWNGSPGVTREWSSSLCAGPQFLSLRSYSEKAVQQFSRSYAKMAGSFQLKFETIRAGVFQNTLLGQVTASSQAPSVEQLAPLVDSANLNYIQTGNLALQPQDTREINLNFSHNSLGGKHTLTYFITVNGGTIRHSIANSSRIDTLGRVLNSPVNADGYRYGRLNGQVKNSFITGKGQWQASISPGVSWSRAPLYINDSMHFFSTTAMTFNPALQYSYRDWLTVNFSFREDHSWYRQDGPGSINIVNAVRQLGANCMVVCTRKLSVGSNILWTVNTFTNAPAAHFTIWNASAAYRLLRGNEAEVKFSALDLLNQNTALVNYGTRNSVTTGTSNVLQRYFMLTFSWYPRKFGKN